jgi:peptide/nickel transport system substrate-binding protein
MNLALLTRRAVLAAGASVMAVAISLGMSSAYGQNLSRAETLVLDSTLERIATPENYNPFLPSTTLQAGLHQVGFESLFYLNLETGELEPWQAESYQFNDAFDEVTITLREGVTWSDGVPFTADDVAFTMQMLKDNSAALGVWGSAASTWIKSVEAVDARTVKFALTSTNPSFVVNTFGARVWRVNQIVPKHIWEGKDPATFTNYDLEAGWPVTTSPYQLVSSNNQETIWDLRPDWWGAATGFQKLPAPKRVIFTSVGTEERRVAMLTNNDIDAGYSIGRDSFETVHGANPNVVTWLPEMPYAYTDAGPRVLMFNNASPPFDNALVRRAVSYAINRDALVDIAWEGMSRPISWVTPSYPALMSYFEGTEALFEAHPSNLFDTARSAELMAEAGYAKDGSGFWADASGNRIVLDLIGRQTEADSAKSAPVVTELLRRAGFDTQFRLLDSSSFYDSIYLGQANIFLTGISGGVTDPYQSFEMYHSRHATPAGVPSTGANSRWANAEYDAIVDQMGQMAPTDPRFKELVAQALEIWLKELPTAPLTDAALLATYNNTYWTGWPTSDNPYFQPCFWWASALVSITKIEPAAQ